MWESRKFFRNEISFPESYVTKIKFELGSGWLALKHVISLERKNERKADGRKGGKDAKIRRESKRLCREVSVVGFTENRKYLGEVDEMIPKREEYILWRWCIAIIL